MKDKEQLILSIYDINDLSKLEKNNNLKYINIDITNPNKKIIDYLLTNGRNLSYTNIINNKPNYIYITYDYFKKGQLLIDELIKSIPITLNDIEKSKYLYIKLGSFLGYDINSIEEKNEIIDLSTTHMINNIWGAISNAKGINKSITELYFYLCRLANIECKIATINNFGYQKNIITIDNTDIIVDLTQDIPYIQSGFKTRFFGTYNDDEELDKKIGYLKEEYNEKKLEIALKKLDYSSNNFFEQILLRTQDIIGVSNIQPIELGIIYNDIFNKYCPNQNISINNLYISTENKKEHFILITHNDKHYSFNYSKNSFVEIKREELTKNIEDKKIGIYDDEKIPSLNTAKLRTA